MWHSNRARHRRASAAIPVAVFLCSFAMAAHAEATLRYNHGYSCNGERIVVGHCRRDSDMPGVAPTKPEDDFCQLYYPDRPKRGGFDAMGMELRGDVIKILEACGAFGSTQPPPNASQSTAAPQPRAAPPPAAQPSAPATRPGAAAVAAPGIGAAPWRHLASFDDVAYFVLPANLQPGKRTGRGWFLVLNRDPQPSDDGRIARVAITQELWTADCVKNTISWLQSFYFDEAGAPLGDLVLPSPERLSVDPSGKTLNAAMLSFLCARHYELDELTWEVTAASIRRIFWIPATPKASAPAQAAAGPPTSAPSGAAPGGRPPIKPMPIGPEMCPLLRRLEGLAREDFRSIDRGPDRAAGKEANEVHRTSMSIPGADCSISRSPGMPVYYGCDWQQTTEEEVDQQFLSMIKTLEKCTGGTADYTLLNEYQTADVTVKARGIDYQTFITNNFLALVVRLATP